MDLLSQCRQRAHHISRHGSLTQENNCWGGLFSFQYPVFKNTQVMFKRINSEEVCFSLSDFTACSQRDSKKEPSSLFETVSLVTLGIFHHGYCCSIEPAPLDAVGRHGFLLRGLLAGCAQGLLGPWHRRLVHLLLGL